MSLAGATQPDQNGRESLILSVAVLPVTLFEPERTA